MCILCKIKLYWTLCRRGVEGERIQRSQRAADEGAGPGWELPEELQRSHPLISHLIASRGLCIVCFGSKIQISIPPHLPKIFLPHSQYLPRFWRTFLYVSLEKCIDWWSFHEFPSRVRNIFFEDMYDYRRPLFSFPSFCVYSNVV